ncbi:type VI secretion system-associated serine/threonine protein kinase [Oleiphilus messinensis]|uniref:Type VI secretion system-associated serine/threonine protein kinase n=2 Tax=Oleiphilus messinensis TaxID=141451 RepID=A0A1Y0IE94_9GAMM|nr:type VI secretion system-associated serine/threonine protein kinase [Oleiphilus messinensis]
MATVYLAIQEKFERHVALKVLLDNLARDESYAKRFEREARTVARLSHQYIVPIYDVGCVGKLHYMAMEYLPGGDLKQKIEKGLSLIDSLRIMKRVAQGIHYAGTKNLVHRDIKPENILFREDDSPVISDFGISRQVDSATNMTVTGTLVGTPHYMSPEQAEGEEIDHRSDLYSLGVILYELLTGDVPFTGNSAITIGIKHITQKPPQLPPQFRGFQRMLDKALAKRPQDRYQNGLEFVQALEMLEMSLSDAGSQTVVMQPVSSGQIKRTTQRTGQRSALRTGGARSRVAPPPSTMDRLTDFLLDNSKAFVFGGLGLILCVILAIWFSREPSPYVPDKAVVQSGIDLNKLVENANAALQEKRLYAPPENNAHYFIETLATLSPNNSKTRELSAALFTVYLAEIETALAQQELAKATQYLNQALKLGLYLPDQESKQKLAQVQNKVNALRQKQLIEAEEQGESGRLLEKGNAALSKGVLIPPVQDNAYSYFLQVLESEPENEQARAGIRAVAEALLAKALQAEQQGQSDKARTAVVSATKMLDFEADDHPLKKKLMDSSARMGVSQAEQEPSTVDMAAKLNAEKKQQQAEQIKNWLTSATEALAASQLVDPPEGNAAYFYWRVLEVEPENKIAQAGLDKVVGQLVELGNAALQKKDDGSATRYLEQARNIGANPIAIVQLTEALESAERDRQINSLVKKAENALNNGRLTKPESDNALNYYLETLRLQPENSAALAGIQAIKDKYALFVKGSLSRNDFTQAQAYVDSMQELLSRWADEQKGSNADALFKSLQNEVSDTAGGVATQAESYRQTIGRKIEGLVSVVNRLEKRPANASNNAQLRDSYLKILKVDPQHGGALSGLKAVSDYEAEQAREDMRNRQFTKALQHIAIIASTHDQYDALTALRSELADTEEKHKQSITFINAARKEIARGFQKPSLFGSYDDERKRLRKAYDYVEQAVGVDPEQPAIQSALQLLENEYVSTVSRMMASGDERDAARIVLDTQPYRWSPERLMELADELQRRAGKSGDNILSNLKSAFGL